MALSSCAEESELRGGRCLVEGGDDKQRETEGKLRGSVDIRVFGPPPLLPRKLVELRNDCVHKGRIPPESQAKTYGEAVLRAEVNGIVTLRNCFDSDLEYDDFVEHHIIRPDASEPHLPSFAGNSVLSAMWRPNERHYRDEDDEPERGEGLPNPEWNRKNPTGPTRLTMDRALSVFRGLRGLGLR